MLKTIIFGLSLLAASSQAFAVIDSSLVPGINDDLYLGKVSTHVGVYDYFVRPQFTYRENGNDVIAALVAKLPSGSGYEEGIYTRARVSCSNSVITMLKTAVYTRGGVLMLYLGTPVNWDNTGRFMVSEFVCRGW